MSFRAMKMVMESRIEGTSGMKFVLLALAHRADAKKGYGCWPSQARIAADIGLKERAVRAHLHSLEVAGYITRTKRSRESGRTSDWIRVNLERLEISPIDDTEPDQAEVEAIPADPYRQILPGQPAIIAGEPINEPISTSPSLVVGAAAASEPQEGPSHGVTFPRFAIARLGKAGERQAAAWQEAWATVTSVEGASWDPVLHLTKYLAQCTDKNRTPTPSDWLKWWTEDEQAAREKTRVAKQQQHEQDKPANPYFE